jgi:spore germination protein GerM
MTLQRAIVVWTLALAIAMLALMTVVWLPRRNGAQPGPRAASVPPPAAAPPAAVKRKIKARLFYVSEDGTHLTGVERDVAYAEGTATQAQEIMAAQLAPAAEPLASAIPPGTTLRALYVTARGQAFVDLSREVATAHSGGSTDELLTIYTIVTVLTANLPAVTSVQILIDGHEAETLAGHVDLRRPFLPDLDWVE